MLIRNTISGYILYDKTAKTSYFIPVAYTFSSDEVRQPAPSRARWWSTATRRLPNLSGSHQPGCYSSSSRRWATCSWNSLFSHYASSGGYTLYFLLLSRSAFNTPSVLQAAPTTHNRIKSLVLGVCICFAVGIGLVVFP